MKIFFAFVIAIVLVFNTTVYGNPVPINGSFRFINHKEKKDIFELKINKQTGNINLLVLSSSPIAPSTTNNIALEIRFYNTKNKVIYKIQLRGFDSPSSINKEELEKIKFNRGDYIKIEMFAKEIGHYDLSSSNTLIIKNRYDMIYEEIRFYIINGAFKVYIEHPPEIIGADDITIEQYSTFDLLEDVTGESEVDGDVTDKITTFGYVDTDVVGTYYMTYSLRDSTLKSTQVSREIKVIPSKKVPVKLNKRTVNKHKFKSNSYFKDYKVRDNYFIVKFK